ncbi:MAG: hypothetical protein RR482_01915 [Clostridia bacterium]
MPNFRNDLKRALGWPWILAVLIVWMAMIVANLQALGNHLFTERVDAISVMVNAFHKSSILPLGLLAVACPYASSYLQDEKSGYAKYQLARSGYRPYILSKFAANAIAGATALCFAQVTFLVFSVLCFPYPDVGYYKLVARGEAMETLFYTSPFFYFMALIGIQSLSSMAWSSLALGLSGYIRNEYISICVPFLVFTLITALSGVNRFFEEIFYACWFTYDAMLMENTWVWRVCVYLAFFSLMLGAAYVLFSKRVRRFYG